MSIIQPHVNKSLQSDNIEPQTWNNLKENIDNRLHSWRNFKIQSEANIG